MGKLMIGMITLVVSGFVFEQFAVLMPSATGTESARFSQKVNLALRRTVHHLLHKVGDDTSRIQPVKQQDAYTFQIQLNHSFDYDQLPGLLKESFRVHDIKANYDVAVLDCAHGELQLGYNFKDLSETDRVPCGGRQQVAGCYTLQVTFSAPEETPLPLTNAWTMIIGAVLLGIGYVAWRRWTPAKQPVSSPNPEPESVELLRIGESSFDTKTQTLLSGSNRHSLTYREAKLLQFFINHPNQVIDRDLILKSVWGDEGIIVGRSVDVFVSRLRKLLQDDPTIRIVAVHGVGYRLEIQS